MPEVMMTPEEREAFIKLALAAKRFFFGAGPDDQRLAERFVDAVANAKEATYRRYADRK